MKLHPFIEAEEAEGHSVKRGCELLEVSRAAYYERRRGIASARELSDAELTTKIEAIHAHSDGTYGSPRVHKELARRGVACGRRRVSRLMRRAGLEGRCQKRWRKTTVCDPAASATDLDLIGRAFGPCVELDARYAATSPTSQPGRAGPTWPPSSTSPPDGLSAGPWPTTCAPSWWPTPCEWPARSVGRARG